MGAAGGWGVSLEGFGWWRRRTELPSFLNIVLREFEIAIGERNRHRRVMADEMNRLFAHLYAHVLQAHTLQCKLNTHRLCDLGAPSYRGCLVLDNLDRPIVSSA